MKSPAAACSSEASDLLSLPPEERARAGLFLGFQYPVEIPGVNNVYLLKAAVNAKRKAAGQPEVDAYEFLQLVRAKMKLMQMDESFLVARRQRRILRRRKEAQRDPADAGHRAHARGAR